jgi:hypothetical protein
MDQNYLFSRFLNFAGWLFSIALDEKDALSLYGAKKLLRSSSIIHKSSTKYLSEDNASTAIFIAVNLANIAYQYIYATWFMYLTTSISGIKKLYKVILENPILGLFFYLSFYFRLLGETDINKFNLVASSFGLESHENFTGSKAISSSIHKIAKKLSGGNVSGYEKVVATLVHKIVSEKIIAKNVESLPHFLSSAITKKSNVSKKIADSPIYVTKRNIETQRDLDEFQDYVIRNAKAIRREIKRSRSRKKSDRSKLIREKVEKRDENGNVICLDKCTERARTKSGCYCEGECGSVLGGKSWCYVDPEKCKKGKYLRKYFGRSYDYCDKERTRALCFTGYRYRSCK